MTARVTRTHVECKTQRKMCSCWYFKSRTFL